MKNKGIKKLLLQINQYLIFNKDYKITKDEYALSISVFEKICKSYGDMDNMTTKATKRNDEGSKKQVKLLKKKTKSKSKLTSKGKYGDDFQNRKSEKNLDGSKGFYKIRENGKFGSHSMYDNMNDESFS